MKKATIRTDKHFRLSEIDKRIYGSFVEHMGRGVYEGIYQPESPFADARGFRRDVIELVNELNVSAIRYPGGNFVSAFNWEDSVGPKSERPVRLEAAWKNIEDNSFGLNEFMDWAADANTEPIMAVNLGTRGIDAARNLLEYCNFPGGTYYSDLRRSHGYEKPHNIKMWCLGNEMDGPWQIGHRSADEYGTLAMQTAKVMRSIDPTIELVACGSAGNNLPTFASWDATVLEHCYSLVDYISVHCYFDNRNKTEQDTAEYLAHSLAFDNQIESIVATCDYVRAKLRQKKRIHLSVDEWNVVYRPHGKVPNVDWTKAPHQIEDVYNVEDALLVGSLLLSLLNHADRVKIGCIAQLTNVIAPIMTSDTGAWRQTIFYPFALTGKYGRGTVLQTVVDAPTYTTKAYGEVSLLDTAVVDNEEVGQLVIFAVNRDLHEGMEVECDLRQYADYKMKEHLVLNHEDIKATNTEEHPDTVVPHHAVDTVFEDGRLTAILEKHSWNVIVLEKK